MARPRKREHELAHPRSKNGIDKRAPEVSKGTLRKVTVPTEDKGWSDSARRIWRGMKSSGQADYFQNSDWALAHFLMGEVTRYQTGRGSAMHLAEITKLMERLLLTEADRRKARIELEEEAPVEMSIGTAAINDLKERLATPM